MVLALTLALGIGLALGLLGSGGSILTLPAMVYGAGVPEHDAVPMSLAVVGVTAAVGAAVQARKGWIDWRAAILFSIGGAAGAIPGGMLSTRVPGAVLMLVFSGIMAVVGVRMLRGTRTDVPVVRSSRTWPALAAGGGVGLLTAFLGAGGGFVVVPVLERFLGLSLPKAIATSLVVIAANCAAGLVVHAGHAHFDWGLTGAFAGLAVAGMAGGVLVGRRLPVPVLRVAFGGFVLAMAVFVAVQSSGVLFPAEAASASLP
ncbi:MAG: sulfite exporter TauE/SafE family protein [Akkermansiaceae bacterium]|nr:sulfite exporter TauE/SafE family protein [Akkermansiaceae bacterium]